MLLFWGLGFILESSRERSSPLIFPQWFNPVVQSCPAVQLSPSCPVVIGSLLFGWCLRLDCTTCLPYDGSVQTAPQPLSGALCVLCRSQTILLLSQENRDILPASIFGLNTLNYDRQRKEPYWSCVKIKKTTMHSVNGKSTKNVFIDGWKQITSTSNMIELWNGDFFLNKVSQDELFLWKSCEWWERGNSEDSVARAPSRCPKFPSPCAIVLWLSKTHSFVSCCYIF